MDEEWIKNTARKKNQVRIRIYFVMGLIWFIIMLFVVSEIPFEYPTWLGVPFCFGGLAILVLFLLSLLEFNYTIPSEILVDKEGIYCNISRLSPDTFEFLDWERMKGFGYIPKRGLMGYILIIVTKEDEKKCVADLSYETLLNVVREISKYRQDINILKEKIEEDTAN